MKLSLVALLLLPVLSRGQSCDGTKIPLINCMRKDASCDDCILPETCVDEDFDENCCAACSSEADDFTACCSGAAADIPVSCDGDKIPLVNCMLSEATCDGCILPETCVDEDFDAACCAACSTETAAFTDCCSSTGGDTPATPTAAPATSTTAPTSGSESDPTSACASVSGSNVVAAASIGLFALV